VFVFIVRDQIDLGNLLRNDPPINLGKGAYLETPVVGDVDAPSQPGQKAEFTGKRVIEGAVIGKKIFQLVEALVMHEASQGLHKWGYKEPGNPAFHSPFGGRDASIIALAEFKIIVRISDRLYEPA
jgi:hypothetical protein